MSKNLLSCFAIQENVEFGHEHSITFLVHTALKVSFLFFKLLTSS